MISSKLQEARDLEEKYLKTNSFENRPLFHLTGTVGWINDPNGFSIYEDKYHLFYQYYPFDTHWGPMHWGHSVSKDLIKWEQLPCALAPDSDYDKDGCFSGSAIKLEDGRHLLIYTSVIRKEGADGNLYDYQQQAVAIGDGVDYEKCEANPVISTDMIPAGGSVHDFRDPKIIKHGEKYYCFVINRHPDGSGQILVYDSLDALEWKFNKVLDRSDNQVGRIWECPDYFELDNTKVLIVSPQETKGCLPNVFPGYNNFFLLGHGKEYLDFNRDKVQPIDLGTDFYAAQTVLTPDGRRVMIAWMQNWESCNYGNDLHDYYGMMTLPRELTIKNGHVYQAPLRELENYYGNTISYDNLIIKDEVSLDGISGRIFDMTVTLSEVDKRDYVFTLSLAKDDKFCSYIRYDSKLKLIKLDRTASGMRFSSLSTREFKINSNSSDIKLRIICDKYAIELFVNDGHETAAMKIDTDINATGISFQSDTEVSASIIKHDFNKDLLYCN